MWCDSCMRLDQSLCSPEPRPSNNSWREAGSSTSILNVKEAALVHILGSLWFNQVR